MVRDVLGGGRCVKFVSLRDDAALVIDNEQGADALVVTDSIDAFLEVSHYLNFLLQLYKIKSNLNFYRS